MNDALLRENYVYVVFEADTLFHSLKKYFIYNNSSDGVAFKSFKSENLAQSGFVNLAFLKSLNNDCTSGCYELQICNCFALKAVLQPVFRAKWKEVQSHLVSAP